MPGSTRKCLITKTQAEILPLLRSYEGGFTVPELESDLEGRGVKYDKQVLYENLHSMIGSVLKLGQPRYSGGRYVKSYELTEVGRAWSWWLSLNDQQKVDQERRRLLEAVRPQIKQTEIEVPAFTPVRSRPLRSSLKKRRKRGRTPD